MRAAVKEITEEEDHLPAFEPISDKLQQTH